MKKLYISFCVLFFSCLLLPGILTLILPHRSFSDMENRPLRTCETLSSDVMSGLFQSGLEELLSDQFPCRSMCVRLQTGLKLLSGRDEVGGAYIGKNGRLYQKITDSDLSPEKVSSDSARYARAADRAGIKIAAMPVPSAGTVNVNQLPSGAPMYDLDAVLGMIEAELPVIDLREALAGQPELYYSSDHHWTAHGSYAAYREWCAFHSIEPVSLDVFSLTPVCDDFLGTLSSKIPGYAAKPDTIEIPALPEQLTVTADGERIGFYDMEAISQKDKYKVFLSGNHGLVVIENPESDGMGCLLIIKDSFANSLVPYLVRHYERIVMIDERYAAADIAALAEEYGASEIAVIKEACNF